MSSVVSPQKIDTKVGSMEYLPVALFGSVMGLTGLASAWRMSHVYFGTPAWLGNYIGYVAMAAMVLMIIAYTVKLLTSFENVRAEFNHPIAVGLFATPIISLLLLPILLAEFSLEIARGIWIIGAAGMAAFAWYMVNRWLSSRQNFTHAAPAWIVPVVGMIDVPLAMPALQLESQHWIMIFSLAIGLFFAVPLFTIVVSRLIFDEPLPPALQPSLMILVAPFAVGFSCYVTTTGRIDEFAQALLMLTLFILAVLLARLKNLPTCCPFRVSWWSVSFPLASCSVATLRYAEFAQDKYADGIAILVLALATIVIVAMLIRTGMGLLRGELRTLTT